MGKYIVTVNGTDRKSEIISETYFVNQYNDEVKEACISIYEEEWSYYSPTNIEVKVIDVEKMYQNFKIDEVMIRKIESKIYNKKRKVSDKVYDELSIALGRKPTNDEVLKAYRDYVDNIPKANHPTEIKEPINSSIARSEAKWEDEMSGSGWSRGW
jgi:hypothetical protein